MSDYNFGDGITDLISYAGWLFIISGVLAVWKLVEIIAWIFEHVSLEVTL